MVKVTIENSKEVNKVGGSAIFATVTDAQGTGKVGNIICADGELDKRVVAMGLANLASNAIDSISNNRMERDFLTLMFLKHFENLIDKRMGKKKSEDALDDLMEFF